ncbi:hypothetical protein [Pseudoalteromonas galatheae]|uniref:hypothetical protein n=1 Tax=Pseudoalteromonas galatheae TaxID=579562 RepID=UPI0030D1B737
MKGVILAGFSIVMLSGCAVAIHDSVEAVKRSIEIQGKREQAFISKEKASFISRAKSIHVTYKVNDLENNESTYDNVKAKMFCNYYSRSEIFEKLNETGAFIPECIANRNGRGDLILEITENRKTKLGFLQTGFEAKFKQNNEGEVLHYIDRERDTLPSFSNVVIGVTATIIDVNRQE